MKYRHKARSTIYTVVGEATLQTAIPVRDGTPVVVYRADADGQLWVRPVGEFADGRFERVEGTTGIRHTGFEQEPQD